MDLQSKPIVNYPRRSLSGETDWRSMTPNVWKAEHAESIRQYRDDERRQVADRKKTRRARHGIRKK